ncbi:MAG: ComEC/Rec2 family competence protein [Treponema sp.]|jgi:competence protein ComEC|nr:ComEC/Rec2 family competence protein [Treponema sp.]
MTNISFLVCSTLGGVLGYYVFSLFAPWVSCVFAAVLFIVVFYAALKKGGLKNGKTAAAALSAPAAVFALGISAALAGGFAIGYVSGTAARKPFSPGLPPEKVSSIRGILLDDPRTGGSGGLANVVASAAGADSLPGCGNVRSSAKGTALVFFPDSAIPRLKEFGRGGEVFVEGVFSPNAEKRYGKPVFSARSVHVVKPASRPEQFRTAARLSLIRTLSSLDPGGLAAALLLGSREGLDQGLERSYRDAGLSHILALSGMHLSFFSGLLAFFLKRPLGKKAAALAGLLFIAVFVFIVGPLPSLVRAAIMYAIGVWAILSDMPKFTVVFLGAAFLIQIAFDPASGLSLSFMLSYAALAGLLLLGEKFSFLMRGRSSPVKALAASLGAFVAAAPFAAAFFGELRPGGIISGLVVVPLTSLFMAASLLFLACGGFFPPAAIKILSVLELVIAKTVSAAALIPGVKAPFFPALALSLSVAALVFFAEKRLRLYRSRLESFD